MVSVILHDYICPECQYMAELDKDDSRKCPQCGAEMKKAYLKPPAVRIGGKFRADNNYKGD